MCRLVWGQLNARIPLERHPAIIGAGSLSKAAGRYLVITFLHRYCYGSLQLNALRSSESNTRGLFMCSFIPRLLMGTSSHPFTGGCKKRSWETRQGTNLKATKPGGGKAAAASLWWWWCLLRSIWGGGGVYFKPTLSAQEVKQNIR